MSRMARTPVPSALALLMLSTALLAAMPAVAQQHGGSLLNAGNDVTVVGAGAANDLGLSPTKGHVVIRDVVRLGNPTTAPIDYAIMYVPPEFLMYTGYPKVLSYTRDFVVSNYTVRFNSTVGMNFSAIGITGGSITLQRSFFQPGVNYTWHVAAVEARGFNITVVPGGSFNTSDITNDLFLDLTRLGLPPIGPSHEAADAASLANITQRAYLEPHELLIEGFYRFRLHNMSFEPGVNLTVELKFGGLVGDDGSVGLKELLFTERPVSIEVYVFGKLDVRLYSLVGSAEAPVSPTSSSRDTVSGTLVTRFYTTTSFRLSVQSSEGEEGGTDWGMVARWAVLIVAIGIIVSIILYPGRKERKGTEPIDEGEEPAGSGPDSEDEEEDEDEASEEAEEPSPDDELARLAAERDARVREMREQYAKAERGELSKEDVERLGDRARADVKRLDQRMRELKREKAR